MSTRPGGVDTENRTGTLRPVGCLNWFGSNNPKSQLMHDPDNFFRKGGNKRKAAVNYRTKHAPPPPPPPRCKNCIHFSGTKIYGSHRCVKYDFSVQDSGLCDTHEPKPNAKAETTAKKKP